MEWQATQVDRTKQASSYTIHSLHRTKLYAWNLKHTSNPWSDNTSSQAGIAVRLQQGQMKIKRSKVTEKTPV
jgi:hypothetical protein